MEYSYEFHPVEKALNATYTRDELEQLTTLQLREICRKEKLVIGVSYKLDRPNIIETILKYRGAKLSTFVEEVSEEQLNKAMNNLASYLSFKEKDKNLSIPARITLYKQIPTGVGDSYIISGDGLFDGNLLLLDDKRQICGILNMKKYGDRYYLICSHRLLKNSIPAALYKNYSFGFLDEAGSKYIYNYFCGKGVIRPTILNCYIKGIPELELLDTEAANTMLVVDFGTSNTSIGAYLDSHYVKNTVKADLQKNGVQLNQINKVRFLNTLSQTVEISEVIPTVVSIKDCSDSNNITYRFGFDALKNARRHSYNNPASVFYGIKKWVNNYSKAEEVYDENGNEALILRKDIIKVYFENLISVAEQQHKCVYRKLHITSPVKQKQQYLEMYKEILDGYEVETESALDEGIAVLYNAISNQIEKKNFSEDMEYQALIIDCGGGTTDLTSCIFNIEDNQITYKLNLTTTYANGDTNFGGNNITFRIFQYLKILFSSYYNGQDVPCIEDIFEAELSDVYRYVDTYGCEQFYMPLEELYSKCESQLPTKFYQYRHLPAEDFMKVRSNFYFLWNLAEKIKIDFYQTVGVVETYFHKQGIKSAADNPKVLSEESWRLNLYKSKKRVAGKREAECDEKVLTLLTDIPQLAITKEEVNILIKADIYNVIKKFIEPIYLEDRLSDFNFIKLTGQTCKIDIFRDALKEFIQGRIIQSAKKEKTVQDYKLTCLEGAVKYQNAQKIGLIAPCITNNAPITPYKLIAYTHSGSEVIMISSLEDISKSYGFVSRNIDTKSFELTLKNAENNVIHTYALQLNIKDFRQTSYEETSTEMADKILQDDIDSIVEDEIKIFTFAFEDKWGFYVLPLARKNKNLFIGGRKYFPFENDEWEMNFFDGKR